VTELARVLENLQAQMAEISNRLAALENRSIEDKPVQPAAIAAAAPATPVAAPQAKAGPEPVAITEEELLAISAAIAAFMGVKAHIRQIRLISTTAWAQQGRVSIQASHRLG
jgi:methylmalonyl-CoA carboxyltransferase large subunit